MAELKTGVAETSGLHMKPAQGLGREMSPGGGMDWPADLSENPLSQSFSFCS